MVRLECRRCVRLHLDGRHCPEPSLPQANRKAAPARKNLDCSELLPAHDALTASCLCLSASARNSLCMCCVLLRNAVQLCIAPVASHHIVQRTPVWGGKCEFVAERRHLLCRAKSDLRQVELWPALFRDSSSGKRSFGTTATVGATGPAASALVNLCRAFCEGGCPQRKHTP